MYKIFIINIIRNYEEKNNNKYNSINGNKYDIINNS